MRKKILFFLGMVFLIKPILAQENQINISIEKFFTDEYSNEMFPNQNGIYNSDASTYIIFDYLKKTKHIDFVSKIVLNNKDISINQFGIYSEFNNHFFNLGILPYQSKRINDFVLSNNSEPFLNFQFGNIKNTKLKSFLLKYDFLVGQLNSRGTFLHEIDYDEFINSEYLINPYIHKKTLKIGYEFDKNKLLVGLTHGVMFAGKVQKGNGVINPDRSFKAFIDAVLVRSSKGKYYTADQNLEGNHLGFWSIELIRKEFEVYINKIFDDGSGQWFDNKFDGIWGVNIKPKNKKIDMINIELTTTKHQSGNVHIPGEGSGVDSYYWHHIYTSGWYINNLSLGHPLISPYNNRMHALKIAMKYNINSNDSFYFSSYIIDRFKNYGPKGTTEGVIFENDNAQRVYIGNFNFSKKLKKESRLIISLGYKFDEIKLMNYKIKFEKAINF